MHKEDGTNKIIDLIVETCLNQDKNEKYLVNFIFLIY